MQLHQFQVGQTYRIRKTDFVSPLDESHVTPGPVLVREILEPASVANSCWDDGIPPTPADIAEWRRFLRVRNPQNGLVHLLHPDTIQSAEPIAQ